MAKYAIIIEDTKDKEDINMEVKVLEMSEEEEKSMQMTKSGMTTYLTAFSIQTGLINQHKDDFIKFQRDAANENALKKLEEERAQKRINNGVERKDDK